MGSKDRFGLTVYFGCNNMLVQIKKNRFCCLYSLLEWGGGGKRRQGSFSERQPYHNADFGS